jgi:O-antigen/teichoic acid export membrane protein
VNPFRNILRLSIGDLAAKICSFLAFVYLARVLGVADYGALEFARAALIYVLLLGDAGLELWATRQAARGGNLAALAGRLIPLRALLGCATFAVLLGLLAVLPTPARVDTLVLIFAAALVPQALSLRWAFMGTQQMRQVGLALVLAQSVFLAGALLAVRGPADLYAVAVVHLIAELLAAGWLLRQFAKEHGGLRFRFTLRGAAAAVRSALPLGAAHGLAFMSFNFDSLLLGAMQGPVAVGLYSAAYKPVTVLLAVPVTYFVGLFPVLSRTWADGPAAFDAVVRRSLQLAATFAVPVAVGGTFVAAPVLDLLFSARYVAAAPALQILVWSAALVMLRGTFRQGLNAAGCAVADLRCAGLATGLNVLLNLVAIPVWGFMGAAVATLASEVVWLAAATRAFGRRVVVVRLWPVLVRPIGAGGLMALVMGFTPLLPWPARLGLGLAVYAGGLIVLGGQQAVVGLWAEERQPR